MKRIFCIISAVIIGCIGSFMVVLGAVHRNVATFENPVSINVYYKSTTTINNGVEFHAGDKGYDEVLKLLGKSLRSSLLTTMIHDQTVINKPIYGQTNYARYDTSMNMNNLVVEMLFDSERNVVCQDDNNTRVIPFWAMLIIIPLNSKYEEMIVYTSQVNDSTNKNSEYAKSTPFILKGNPKSLIKYVEQNAQ